MARVDGPVRHASLALADKCQVLKRPTGRWVSYPAGTVITDTVGAIITAAGETAMQMIPSSATLGVPTTLRPEDTWLRVCNELLKQVACGSLWVDRAARYRIGPYVTPANRPAGPINGAGQRRMRRQWGRQLDLSRTPTGVCIVVAARLADQPRDAGRATDVDHLSPHSGLLDE